MKLILVLSAIVLLIPNLAQAQNGYTTVFDPQGLFSMEVPQGWYCQGGSYVDSTGVPCYYVAVASPDNSVMINLGDTRIKAIIPQMSGRQYAKWYYQNYIANDLQGAQAVSDQDYQDGSGAVGYTYGNYAGLVYAKTEPMSGNQWGIDLLYNVIAPSNELDEALSIVQHMIQTTRWSTQQQSNYVVNSYASDLNRQTQDYTNNAFQDVYENQRNAAEHAANRWHSYMTDEPDSQQYIWESDGQTLETSGYGKPTEDSELVY